MLNKITSRLVCQFSRSFYAQHILEYPINRSDESLLKNKAMMDEVNNNYVNILKKVDLFAIVGNGTKR